MSRLAPLASLAVCLMFCAPVGADDLGLRVPDGFEVSLYADDSLAHDIFSMTIDSRGRVVVAGLDYVKILEDTDRNGRADLVKLYSDKPASGAHGMYFEGHDLICTGDNAVLRLRDKNGDDRADGPGEVLTHLKHPEHGANGLVKGPDGWYYVITGNDAGITAAHASLPGSPVKRPVCGGVVRIKPQPLSDGRYDTEIVAHGLRNTYDVDFDADGHMFSVDADGEYEHRMPYYAPNRLFDIAQGREHGWVLTGWTRSWSRPQSFFDAVTRLVEVGRGSPTGVVVYRHRQFPERYRGGVFSLCWTLGRVYYFPLEREGASYKSKLEVFCESTGTEGFAPCDMAIGPDGDMFVAIGGRRTRGSVFRIRHKSGKPSEIAGDDLTRVLAADQPLASWSRERWAPMARKLGSASFERALADAKLPDEQRMRAVEVLTELFGGVRPELAEKVISQSNSRLNARIAWALARLESDKAQQELLAKLTDTADPWRARAAWEAIGALPELASNVQPACSSGLENANERVRSAAIYAASGPARKSYEMWASPQPPKHGIATQLAELRIRRLPVAKQVPPPEYFIQAIDCFKHTFSRQLQLDALRLLQLGLGDIHSETCEPEALCGYTGNLTDRVPEAIRKQIIASLAPVFPTRDAEANRELARLMAMLAADHRGFMDAVSRQWSTTSTPEDDVHYLLVLMRLSGPRSAEVRARTAAALVRLQRKFTGPGAGPGKNWAPRVGEAFEILCKRDPKLAMALVEQPAFGRMEHTLFAMHMQGNARRAATQKIVDKIDDIQAQATSELITLVSELPDEESLPFLREAWESYGLRDAVVVILARRPRIEDRDKFLDGLTSVQPAVVEKAARALVQLGPSKSGHELAIAVEALRHACVPDQRSLRVALAALLKAWSGAPVQTVDVPADPNPLATYKPWFDWFAQSYPAEAAKLNAAGEDFGAWQKRLPAVRWELGSTGRGRGLFERKACHRCHLSNGQLGPDLTGAITRMSREDLLAAIVDPNREVAPAFQVTALQTQSGQIYTGIIFNENPENVLLKTGVDTTARVPTPDIAARKQTRQSLMPVGLLNGLSNEDVADLFAYLKSIAKK